MPTELFSTEAIIPSIIFIIGIVGTAVAIGVKLGKIETKLDTTHDCNKRIEGKIDAHIEETKPLIEKFHKITQQVETHEEEIKRLRATTTT